MSGHSKWSSIKHKKGAADAKRGQLFTKLTRALIVAAKDGGPDPAANLALQNAIDKARAASMPKDNIERAIARGSGTGADAAGAVALVGDVLVRRRVSPGPRPAGDRPLDVVLGHRCGASLLDRILQCEVPRGIGAAVLGGDDQRARQLREQLTALRIRGALLVLDRAPFGMP